MSKKINRTINKVSKDKQENIEGKVDKNNQTDMTEKLYLVLIGTPGIFATIIKMVTRIKYIHLPSIRIYLQVHFNTI